MGDHETLERGMLLRFPGNRIIFHRYRTERTDKKIFEKMHNIIDYFSYLFFYSNLSILSQYIIIKWYYCVISSIYCTKLLWCFYIIVDRQRQTYMF